jgi:arsenic resistance protein ArsH
MTTPLGAGDPLRVLLLYGSLRTESVSRLLALEAVRVLRELGADPLLFEPHDLPLHGSVENHDSAEKLRQLCAWSQAQVWCTPEAHGSLSAVLKNQLDWIPLEWQGAPLLHDKPVALLQVSGGARATGALNTMRLIARHMHMLAVPSQLSLGQAYREFDNHGVLTSAESRDRLHRVLGELSRFGLMLRADRAPR